MCEHVGNDLFLRQVGGLPLVPGRGEIGEQLLVVDGEQRLVRVRLGLDDPPVERIENRVQAGGRLGRRAGHADPDLGRGLVEQAAIAPDDRHGKLHAATLQSSRER